MAYWRAQAKAGHPLAASVVHTTSIAAFAGNFGQANYTAAKSAVLGLSRVVALEGAKIGALQRRFTFGADPDHAHAPGRRARRRGGLGRRATH